MMKEEIKSTAKFIELAALLMCLLLSTAHADLVLHYDFEENASQQAAGVVIDKSDWGNDGEVETGWAGYDLPQYITSHDGSNAMLFGYHDANAGEAWNNVFVNKSDSINRIGLQWAMAFWVRVDQVSGSWHEYPKIMSCPNYEIILHNPSWPQSYFWPWDESPAYPDSTSWDFEMANTDTYEGSWMHMAVTYDGTTFTQYINGNPVFTKSNFAHQFDHSTWDQSWAYWTDNYLRIGTQSDGPGNGGENGYLVGALDDVAIWNEHLDANQVNQVKDGNFTGPWEKKLYESDAPTTFLWDSSFIAQKYSIILEFGEKRKGSESGVGIPSNNWQIEGNLDDPNYWGLVNAGLLDGEPNTIEYAAYTTVGSSIVQPQTTNYADHRRIHKDTKYDLKVRFAGSDANGNIIGVKFWAAEVNNPDNLTLLADLNQVIDANETWYEFSTTFTADEVNYPGSAKTFKVKCYVLEGTGNPRGTAFGWFDYVRIDVNSVLTCEAYYHYKDEDVWVYGEPMELSYDFFQDCRTDFNDYAVVADDWYGGNPPEPSVTTTELMANADFYEDINRVPNNYDSDNGPPTGCSFYPDTNDANKAGIWNLDRNGLLNNWDYQPAGGSVVAFIDVDTELRQAATTPIVNGQTYYLSAMVGGTAYQHVTEVIWEYVDDPEDENPGTVIPPDVNYLVNPKNIVWRKLTTEWTAGAGAEGKYLRARVKYWPLPTIGAEGWGLIGKISADTEKPDDWPRQNLLINGDFEDVSNLDDANQFALLLTEDSDTYFAGLPSEWPVGWKFEDPYTDEGGLQCMLWAPSPQPAHGRISVWLGFISPDFQTKWVQPIDQDIDSEAIAGGQTYYLDFIGTIGASYYNSGDVNWPDPDPNLVVEVYWLDDGIEDIYNSGGKGTDWDGPIVTLKQPADGSLGGSGGHWQTAATSFTADTPAIGKYFFVRAYAEAPYAKFEEIYLSKEPPPEIGPYTCYELKDKGLGTVFEGDLNGDCIVDYKDMLLFVTEWLYCNDPEGCS